MTNQLNPDSTTPKTGILPFAPGELDRSGLRLTRAEFARFLGVSKQACGEWVASGKITLGADGRLDPRQAVSQLLRNSDPARLRAKVLEPLARDIGKFQRRVAELEAALTQSNEEASFHEESGVELIAQWNALERCLLDERDVLALLPADKVIAAIIAWMGRVADGHALAAGLAMLDCVPDDGMDMLDDSHLSAPETTKGGGWDDGIPPTPDELAKMADDLEKIEVAGND